MWSVFLPVRKASKKYSLSKKKRWRDFTIFSKYSNFSEIFGRLAILNLLAQKQLNFQGLYFKDKKRQCLVWGADSGIPFHRSGEFNTLIATYLDNSCSHPKVKPVHNKALKTSTRDKKKKWHMQCRSNKNEPETVIVYEYYHLVSVDRNISHFFYS